MTDWLALAAIALGVFLAPSAVVLARYPARRLLCRLRGHDWLDRTPADPLGFTTQAVREMLAAGPLESRILAIRWMQCRRCRRVEIRG